MTDTHGDLQVVLIGGWAQPLKTLMPLQRQLAQLGPVHPLILDRPEAALQAEFDERVRQFSGRTLAVGWSLGGQLLIHFSTGETSSNGVQEKLAGLVCIASNPCFVGDIGWPGVGEQFFEQFEAQLQEDVPRLLTRFFKMQLVGDPHYKTLVKTLQPALTETMDWPVEHLSMSLQWLRSRDCRKRLSGLVTTHFFFGQQDRLVPVEVAALMASKYPQHHVLQLSDMAHYPHSQVAADIVRQLREQHLA